MKKTIPLYIIIILSSMFQGLNWTSGHNWGGDFSQYIMQGISVANGTIEEFIKQSEATVNSSSYPIAPVTYPWGFPILISLVYIFFGLNLIIFKSIILFFFISFLIVIWFLYEKDLDISERLILVSLFAFNPHLLKFGDRIVSDIPFLFFSTLSIFIITKLEEKRSLLSTILYCFILGLCFMISTTIRSHGIILPVLYFGILSLIFFQNYFSKINFFSIELLSFKSFTSSRMRLFCYLIPIIIFAIFISYFSTIFPSRQESHFDVFESMNIKSILYNILYYSALIKDFFSSQNNFQYFLYNTDIIGFVIYIFTIPFVFLGLKKKWKISPVIIIYTVITLVLYITYPGRQGLRYIFPILPFYIYFLLIGFRSLNVYKKNIIFRKNFLSYILLLVFFFFSSFQIYKNTQNDFKVKNGPYNKESQELFSYIKTSVPKDNTIIFFKPRVLTLFTDRNSVLYNKIDDFKIREWYVVNKNSLLILDQNRKNLFNKFPAQLVYENNQFIVYKFN